KEPDISSEKDTTCKLCHEHEEHVHPTSHKVKGAFSYAFGELLSDIGGWLLLGVMIGGMISYFLPEEFIQNYLGSGWKAMVIMLIVGMPMYVCATGSIPIAAALIFKGMNPGAAFVFLLAGPATNAVGMTLISKQMGKKALAIYLFSIAISSILLGLLLDAIWGIFNKGDIERIIVHRGFLPDWVGVVSSVVLLVLIVYNYILKFMRQTKNEGIAGHRHA
ncbi:permease, partial [Candidatus Omnitrophota bacterium]